MPSPPQKPFNLRRWFSVLSLISVGLFSLVSAVLVSRFLHANMLRRDATVTMEFVQSIAQAQNTTAYFENRAARDGERAFEDFFSRIVVMPEVERVNVYGKDGTILWSDQAGFIGQNFSRNIDLERALAGRLAVNTGASGRPQKAEHVFDRDVRFFAEIYIPIWNDARDAVVGAVEVYKVPLALFEAIRRGQRLVWITAAGGGVFLYAALYWVVRRADDVIRRQQARMIESETMAAVGELSSAIAHSIRNPLAAIRSSAELAAGETAVERLQHAAKDIITESDRLDRLIRELLSYSRPFGNAHAPFQLNEVIREVLLGFHKEMERRRVTPVLELAETLPLVDGDPVLLAQMFNSLASNALEAMPDGGTVTVTSRLEGAQIVATVADSGRGMSRDQIESAFRPLFTTKKKGLGMGLTLCRLIVERHGGRIAISSEAGRGTQVHVQLPLRR